MQFRYIRDRRNRKALTLCTEKLESIICFGLAMKRKTDPDNKLLGRTIAENRCKLSVNEVSHRKKAPNSSTLSGIGMTGFVKIEDIKPFIENLKRIVQ